MISPVVLALIVVLVLIVYLYVDCRKDVNMVRRSSFQISNPQVTTSMPLLNTKTIVLKTPEPSQMIDPHKHGEYQQHKDDKAALFQSERTAPIVSFLKSRLSLMSSSGTDIGQRTPTL
jgi:hypothetical protein